MGLSERVIGRLVPDLRSAERRARLIELVDQTLPEFRQLINSNATDRTGVASRRLRQLLENNQVMLAIIDKKRGHLFKLFADKFLLDGNVYLTVVINAGKFLQASTERRNEALTDLTRQFLRNRSRLSGEVISRFPKDFGRFWEVYRERLRTNGVDPENAVLMQYG